MLRFSNLGVDFDKIFYLVGILGGGAKIKDSLC